VPGAETLDLLALEEFGRGAGPQPETSMARRSQRLKGLAIELWTAGGCRAQTDHCCVHLLEVQQAHSKLEPSVSVGRTADQHFSQVTCRAGKFAISRQHAGHPIMRICMVRGNRKCAGERRLRLTPVAAGLVEIAKQNVQLRRHWREFYA